MILCPSVADSIHERHSAEQADDSTFNRGKLKNVGFREAMATFPYTCVIFHDVDLIPEQARCKLCALYIYKNIHRILINRKTLCFRSNNDKLFRLLAVFTIPLHVHLSSG